MNNNLKPVSLMRAAVVASALALSLPAQAQESSDPIKLTLHDWTGQLITTQLMGSVLKEAGYNVEYVQADYLAQFAGLESGDLHIAMEIWETTGREALDEAVAINSTSASSGDGSVKRNEKLTLRVAATIVNVLPNGVLEISGSQELRVNFELRELLVSGYVRPEDISRKNEITYDKIASARVSYGGRGQITDVQQPRLGQQVLDAILPF